MMKTVYHEQEIEEAHRNGELDQLASLASTHLATAAASASSRDEWKRKYEDMLAQAAKLWSEADALMDDDEASKLFRSLPRDLQRYIDGETNAGA